MTWPPTHYMQRGTEIFVWGVFAISYDLLNGFHGHRLLRPFALSGDWTYSVAIVIMKLHLSPLVALGVAIAASTLVSLLLGSLSLRLKGHYFAMITLAFAEVGHVLALKTSKWTGGEDGLTVRVPLWLANRVNDYFIGLLFLVLIYLLVRRVTQSPTGRVLAAIRENEFRAAALGYNVTAYKVTAMTLAGVVASLAGVAMASLDTRFAISTLSTAGPTIDVLLMTVMGGVGTLIGPVLGAAVVKLLSYWLPSLTGLSPIFQRWTLVLGLIYIGIVLFLPFGIVGTYRTRLRRALERITGARKETA